MRFPSDSVVFFVRGSHYLAISPKKKTLDALLGVAQCMKQNKLKKPTEVASGSIRALCR